MPIADIKAANTYTTTPRNGRIAQPPLRAFHPSARCVKCGMRKSMRAWAMVVAVGVGISLLVGCIRSNLVTCDDGRVCGKGLACDQVHQSCVLPSQLAACEGKVQDATCELENGGTGRCFDQVCLLPGCGNGVVEQGEVCDDGNRTRADGCSDLCDSTEICGDGQVDVFLGEQCDDGNLVNHDGCDSSCAIETINQNFIGIHPVNPGPSTLVLDEATGKTMYVGSDCIAPSCPRITWLHDGTTWAIVDRAGPLVSSGFGSHGALVYDTDHQQIWLLSFSQTVFGQFVTPQITVAVWQGTSWRDVPVVVPANFTLTNGLLAFYQHEQMRIVVVDTGRYLSWSLSTDPTSADAGVFLPMANLPRPPGMSGFNGQAIYDRSQDEGLIFPFDQHPAYKLQKDMWITLPPVNTWDAGVSNQTTLRSVVYDSVAKKVVELTACSEGYYNCEGNCDFYYCSITPMVWSRTGFVAAPERTAPAAGGMAVFDRTTDKFLVFTGRETLAQNRGGSWQRSDSRSVLMNVNELIVTDRETLITSTVVYPNVGYQPELYRIDGSQVVTNPIINSFYRIAYDPKRKGLVGLIRGSVARTMFLSDEQRNSLTPVWQELVSGGPVQGVYDQLRWDPSRSALVQIGAAGTFRLGSADTSWIQIALAPPSYNRFNPTYRRLFFDRTCGCLSDGNFHLVAGVWLRANIVLDFDQCVAWSSRSSLLCSLSEINGGSTWESRDRSVTAQAAVLNGFTCGGLTGYAGCLADTPATGGITGLGTYAGMYGELHYGYASAKEQTCLGAEAAVDTDQDGLAGCNDADCWWACTPACPTGTSCP